MEILLWKEKSHFYLIENTCYTRNDCINDNLFSTRIWSILIVEWAFFIPEKIDTPNRASKIENVGAFFGGIFTGTLLLDRRFVTYIRKQAKFQLE